MPNLRLTQMKRRRRRKLKLAQLRKQYEAATSSDSKAALLAKVAKVSPGVTEKMFLAPSRTNHT